MSACLARLRLELDVLLFCFKFGLLEMIFGDHSPGLLYNQLSEHKTRKFTTVITRFRSILLAIMLRGALIQVLSQDSRKPIGMPQADTRCSF